jgi:hypothetical protein
MHKPIRIKKAAANRKLDNVLCLVKIYHSGRTTITLNAFRADIKKVPPRPVISVAKLGNNSPASLGGLVNKAKLAIAKSPSVRVFILPALVIVIK